MIEIRGRRRYDSGYRAYDLILASLPSWDEVVQIPDDVVVAIP